MKTTLIKMFGIAALLLLLQPGLELRAETFKIDPVHSNIEFKVQHMVISYVTGRFEKFSGEFFYEKKKFKKWNVAAEIETASINTGNEKRDGHLKSKDFFDSAKYPHMKFKSTQVTDYKKGKAKLHGILTLHGVEKPVVLDLAVGGTAKDGMGNLRVGFEATGTINRKDFGMTFNKLLEAGGLMVGNKVQLTLNIQGIEKKEDSKKSPAKK